MADFKFSYSEKRDINICPHRYEIISVRKFPQTIDIRRLLNANVLDLAFTEWIKIQYGKPLKEIAELKFIDYVRKNRSIRWKHPMDAREKQLQLVEAAVALENVMRNEGLCLPDAVGQYWVKKKIQLSDGKTLNLTGKLDLLYTDQLWIYDLKTTRNVKWLDRDQLIYYDFVLSLILGKKIKRCGLLAPLIDPPVQHFEVTKDDWRKLQTQIDFAIKTVTDGEFPDTGNEKEDCFMCFAKQHCRRYKSNPIIKIEGTSKVSL